MKKRIVLAIGIALFLSSNVLADVSQRDIQRYSAYYSNGMQYLKNQQFSSAISEFRKVLRFSPYDETIQNALVNAYYARAQYFHKTTKEAKKALVDYKNAYFYAKYWNNGIDANLANSIFNEINSLEKKLAISQNPQSRLQNAKALKAQGELAASGYDFQQLKNSQYKEIVYENLGNIYKNLNNLSQGMDYMKEAININPKNAKLHFMYGVMLDSAKNYEASMEQYNLALQYGDKSPELMEILENKWTQSVVDSPNNAQGYINLGAIYQKQGNLEAARAQYQKAYQLNPDDEVIMYNLASLYVAQKNHQGALNVYDKILAKNPSKIDVLEYKATALRELMRYDEALSTYEQLLALNPNNNNAKANIEDIVMNNFSGEKLRNYLGKKAAHNPNSYEAQFNYALELHKNKNNALALEYYRKALTLNPAKEEVYLNLAQIYIEEQDYKSANEVCQKGLLVLPNNQKLKTYLADIKNYNSSSIYATATKFYEQKNYQSAISKYLEIENKTLEVNMAIASCYWQLQDYATANKYYQEVLKKEPNNLEVLSNSAWAYYSLNDIANAKAMLNKILSYDKANKNAQDLLNSIYETEYSAQLQEAISLYEQAQYGKSFAILDSYLTKKPNDSYAMYYKGLILEEMKKPQDAIKQYRALISKDSSFAPAYYSLAVALDNAEKYDEAVKNYEKFISLKGNENDEMTNFSSSRIKELKEYLSQVNGSQK
ncbi:MAG: tetratricopeptide repeat protein [Candidatus Gastranaerophilales bacterium]|nr:tetratricopeptide repeat protein [Candidatus Gastranaerophilales bacterium]